MATEQTVLDVVLSIKSHIEGFGNTAKTVSDLKNTITDEFTNIENANARLFGVLAKLSELKPEINTKGVAESVDLIETKIIALRDILSTNGNKVNKTIKDMVNEVIKDIKLAYSNLEVLSKPIKVAVVDESLKDSTKVVETFADRYKVALDKIKDAVKSTDTPTALNNVKNALQKIGEAGEVGKGGVDAFVKAISRIVTTKDIGKTLGDDFIKELRSRVTPGIINTIFKEAFSTGDTRLLEPLKNILGDTSFLGKFERYVRDTFGGTATSIKDKLGEAGKSLQTFGAHTIESESRLEGFKSGVITTTNEIRKELEVFENFEKVQKRLNKLFSADTLSNNITTFTRYGNDVKATEAEIAKLIPLIQQIDRATTFDASISQALEFNKAIASVQSRLNNFKNVVAAVNEESQKNGLTPKLQEQLNVLTAESVKLQEIKTHLEQASSIQFNNQQLTAQLQLQQVSVANLLTEVDKLRTTGGTSPLLDSLTVGLGLAQTNITELQNKLSLLPVEADKQAKAVALALANATGDVSTILEARIGEVTRRLSATSGLLIPPIQVKTLDVDTSGVKTTFDNLTGLITGLNHNWENFKSRFGSKLNLGEFDSLRTSINVLAPVFDRLRDKSTTFGSSFNSSTTDALSNLHALESALTLIGKATGQNLTGPIESIVRLREELVSIGSAETTVGRISESLINIHTPANDAAISVGRIQTAIKDLKAGEKITPDEHGFSRTKKDVDALLKRLEEYRLELEAIEKQSLRKDNTQIFGAELRNAIGAALADITRYTTILDKAKTTLKDLGETRVDTSTIDKDFVKLGKTVQDVVRDIVGGLNRLGDDSVYKGAEGHLKNILSNVVNKESLVTAINEIEALVKSFGKAVTSTRPNIAVEGYNETSNQFIKLIDLVHNYINSVLATTKLEAANNPKANLDGLISGYTTITEQLQQVRTGLTKTSEQFNVETNLIELHKKAIDESEKSYNDLNKQVSQTSGAIAGATFTQLADSVRQMGIASNTAVADIGKLIKALEGYAKTSKDLPPDLATIFGGTSVEAIIGTLRKSITNIEDSNKAYAKQANQLLGIETELKTIGDLTGKAFTPPNNVAEFIIAYDDALKKIVKDSKEAAINIGDFTGLQRVYAEHKTQADNLYHSLESIIVALRQAGVATVTFGNNPIETSKLIEGLEQVRRKVTGTSAEIRVALQRGGSALDDYLLTASSGTRYAEIYARYDELAQRTRAAMTAMADLQLPGAVVSTERIGELRREINNLVKEREGLLKDVKGGLQRIDVAWQLATKNLDVANLGKLKGSIDTAKADFDTLIKNIKTVPAESSALTKAFGDFETVILPVTRFNEAIATMDALLSRAGNGATAFDVVIQKLMKDLEETKKGISAVKSPLEEQPKEVLKTYLTDLNVKLEELKRSYTEVLRSTRDVQKVNAPVDAALLTKTTQDAERLRLEISKVEEAISTLKNLITHVPQTELLNIKEFERLSDTATKVVRDITSGFHRLGDPDIYVNAEDQIKKLLSTLTDKSQVKAGVDALIGLVADFGKRINQNPLKLSVEGFNQTATELTKLIELYDNYARAALSALRIEATKNPANAEVQGQIALYEDLISKLNDVTLAKTESDKAFRSERGLENLNAQAVASTIASTRLEAALTDLTAAGKTPTFEEISIALRNFNNASTTAISDIDKLIKALEEYRKTSDALPEAFSKRVGVSSVDQYIKEVMDVAKEIKDTTKTISQNVNVGPLLAIEDELRAIASLNQRAFIPPNAAIEFANEYATALDSIANRAKSAATSVQDFSGLQQVYTEQKKEVDNLYGSLERVLKTLRESGAATITIGSTSIDTTELIKKLEDLRKNTVETTANIRTALKSSGVSLDEYLLSLSGGTRFKEVEERYKDLSKRITSALQSIEDLQKPGAVATTESVKELRGNVDKLIKEREAFVKEVQGGINQLDTAFNAAVKNFGGANVVGLETGINAAKAALNGLIISINTISTAGGTGFGSFKDVEKAVSPVLRFNEAVAQMGELLNRAVGTGATAFDKTIGKLVKDLEDAKNGIGLVKSELEQQPKEVLKTYFNDLTVKAEELKKAYIEVLRSMRDVQNSGTPVDSTLMTKTTEQAEQLRLEMAKVGEAMSTLKMLMSRAPETAGLNLFEGVATSMADLRDGGALLSKVMKGLFDSMLGDTKLKQVANSSAEASKQFEVLSEKTKIITAAYRELEDKLVSGLRNMDMMTMGLQMIGQAMLDPFKKATEGFIKFSDTMAFIKGVVGGTDEQMKAMTEAAVTLGSTTRMSAEQAADALKQLALAGYSAQDSMAVLPTVIRVAQAAEMQLGESTGILVNIMQGQRMGVEQIGKASDVLSLAANRTTATFSDMGTSFKYIGALAATSKNDFEDTAAAIGLLHNAGLRGCYDDQTEVMTRSGFKLFKELKYEDEILTLNRDSLELEWQKPRNIVQYDVSEDLIYIRSGAIDLAVTKEHNLFIETVTGTRKLLHASKFKDGKFFRTGIWHGNNPEFFEVPGITRDRGNYVEFINSVKIPTTRWVEFLGWYFSEGSLHLDKRGNYRIRITQKSYNKDFDSLKTCLESLLPFKFKYDGLSFVCRSVQLFRLLEKYGVGTFNKKVPDYVKEYSPDLIQTFLESYRKGDGDASFTLYTSNEQLAFDLQELGIKAGYGTSFNVSNRVGKIVNFVEGDQTRPVIGTKPCYDISIATTHTHPFISKSEIARNKKAGLSSFQKTYVEERYYKGVVYCAEVPNHTMYVRRNGKGVFCGNSMAGTALRGVLQALLNPTRDEAKIMGDLGQRLGGTGLQVLDAQGKFVGFRRVIEQFERAGISTSEILELFGQRAGPGMAALLQVGSKAVGDLERDLRNADGTTSRLSQNMEETFGGKLAMMKNSLSAFGDIVGHAVSVPLGYMADLVAGLTQRLIAFGEAYPGVTAAMIDTAGAIAALIAGFGSLSLAMTMMLIPTLQFLKFLGTTSTVFFKTSGMLMSFRAGLLGVEAAALGTKAGLEAAIKGASGFKGALGILLTVLMNPYFLAFAAIAGIIGFALYKMTKSTAVTNAELEKQREAIANTSAEFDSLNSRIKDTINHYQALANQKKELTPKQFMDLPEAKSQLNNFGELIEEYISRLNNPDMAGEYLAKRIMDVTGRTIGLKVTLKSTGEEIAHVNEAMLAVKGGPDAMIAQFDKLDKRMDDFAKKRDAALFAKQLSSYFKKPEGPVTDATLDAAIYVPSEKEDLDAQARYDKQLRLFEEYKVKRLKLQDDLKEAIAKRNTAIDTQASLAVRRPLREEVERLRREGEKLTEEFKVKLGSGASSLIPLFESKDLNKFLDKIQSNLKVEGNKINSEVHDRHEDYKKALEAFVTQYPNADEAYLRRFFRESILEPMGYSEEEIQKRLDILAGIFKNEIQKVVEVEPFDVGVEKNFRNLQRTIDGGLKNIDSLLKGLATRSEEYKKVLEDYTKNVDVFAKVREQYVAAGKAALDLNLSELEQKSSVALDHITMEGVKTSGKVTDSFVKWKDTSVNLTEAEANRFAVLQQVKVDKAKAASTQIYSLFSTSLRKQIDDLERESEVVKNVYSIPEREVKAVPFGWADKTATNAVLELTQQTGQFTDVLVASEKAGYQFKNIFTNIKPGADAIKSYVADAKYSTGELLNYTITFDATLARARLYQEQRAFDEKSSLLDQEKAKVEEYYNKILPLYGENTTQRMDKEIEFATKQKELAQKGYDNSKSTLDKLYEYHKQISDKIKNIKKDEAAFIASLDKINKKVDDSGKNDVQKLEEQKQQIRDLYEQAQATDNLDERKARLVEIRDLMSNMEFQPWDEDTKSFLKTFTDKLRTDMPQINRELTQTGLLQQKSLEDSGASVEKSQAKFQEMMEKFAKNLDEFAKRKQEIEATLGEKQGVKIESEEAYKQLTALEDKIINIRRLLETAPNVNLGDLSKLDQVSDKLKRVNQDKDLLETERLRAQVLQQQTNETSKLLGLKGALLQAEENYQNQSLGQEKINELENRAVGELKPEVVDDINVKLRERKMILDNLKEAYRDNGVTIPAALNKESEAVDKAIQQFREGKDKRVIINKELLSALDKNNDLEAKIESDRVKVAEDANKAMLGNLESTKEGVVNLAETLDKISSKENTPTQVRQSPSSTTGAHLNEARKVYQSFEDLWAQNPGKAEEYGYGKKAAVNIMEGVNQTLKQTPVEPIYKLKDQATQQLGTELTDKLTQYVKDHPFPVTPDIKTDSTTIRQSATELTKGLEQFLGKKPVEITTEVSAGAVADTTKAVGNLKGDLVDLAKASRDALGIELPAGNVKKIFDLSNIFGKLSQAKTQDTAVTIDNIQALEQTKTLLTDLATKSASAFVDYNKGNAVGKTLDALEESRTALLKQDLTNANVKSQWEDNTSALEKFKEILTKLSEQPATTFLADPTSQAQQDLKGVGAELQTLAAQFDEFRSKAKGKDFVDSEKTATDLKSLQDQYQQFVQRLGQGQAIDPAKLEEFKITFDNVSAAMKDKRIDVNMDGITAAEGKLTSLQNLMSTLPTFTVQSDTSPIDAAINRINQLLLLDGRTTTVDVVTNYVTNKREGGVIGYREGGFIQAIAHLAKGGMAAVQRLASGGQTAFNRISEVVPGSGTGDIVPAMLEPGEFVVKKSTVQRYGHDFMQRLNEGLIQFRSLGGAIFRLPTMAMGGIANYVTPKFNIPEMQAVGGFGENVHLHFGNKEFIVKSPRDKVKDLVNAVKQLDRGY